MSGPARTTRTPDPRSVRSRTDDAVPGSRPRSVTVSARSAISGGTSSIAAGDGPPGAFALVATSSRRIATNAAGITGTRMPTDPTADPDAAAKRA